jgi:hypothetical protein
MFRFLKNPFGFAFTATAVILALSPEARKAARRLAVKGTAAILDLADQMKEAVNQGPEEVKSFFEEAQLEKTSLHVNENHPVTLK